MSIKINTRKVYDSGVFYRNQADIVLSIRNNLLNIADDISKNYTGVASHNFLVSFKTHVAKLNDVLEVLDENGELLKENALSHGSEDTTFATKVERSDIDEF